MKKWNLLVITLVCLGTSIEGFGQFFNGLSFDGEEDYVELNALTADFVSLENYTIEFWMKADREAQSGVRTNMFSINRPAPDGENEFLIIVGGTGGSIDDPNEGRLMIYDQDRPGSPWSFVSETIIGDNECHHIAYVREGSTARVYIDGELKSTHEIYYNVSPGHRVSLGQDWDSMTPSDFYHGMLDEFRLWEVSRSEEEINEEIEVELTGTEIGLIAYYDFNQGVPGGDNPDEILLLDRTDFEKDGNLVGFDLNGELSNWVRNTCLDGGTNSVDDYLNEIELVVYPNPANGHVFVRTSSQVSIQQVIIRNMSGQIITVFDGNNTLNVMISVDEFESGQYIVEVMTGLGKTTSLLTILN